MVAYEQWEAPLLSIQNIKQDLALIVLNCDLILMDNVNQRTSLMYHFWRKAADILCY